MSPDNELPPEIAAALEELGELVCTFEEHPDPAVQERAAELLRCVDRVHRCGLRRLAQLLRIAGLEQPALAAPEVRLLFELYELGEGGERARADAVLDTVRPDLKAQGGRVEVVKASAGVVTVRLAGGCQGSAAALRDAVEQTLRAGLPDFVRLEVAEPPQPAATFVPAAALKLRPRPRLVWHPVFHAGDVPAGTVRGLEIEGEPVLIANLAGEFYAYRNVCPGSPLPLHGGTVEGESLRCPWHGCRFSLRGGKRLDAEGPGLGVLPIAVEDGEVKIGVLKGAGV